MKNHESTAGGDVRILLIDDDDAMRLVLAAALERAGYGVVEAENGKRGIELVREQRPNLVITDIVMPEKDGVETIIELRRDFPEVKIIAISGSGRELVGHYLRMAGKLGAKCTLTKPFSVETLLDAVGRVLASAG